MNPCTHSTYNMKKHGDCDGCRTAHSQYVARQKADHRNRTEAQTIAYHDAGGQGGIPSLIHGKASSREYLGCDCADCLEAARQRWRESSRRHRTIKRLRQAQERQANASHS